MCEVDSANGLVGIRGTDRAELLADCWAAVSFSDGTQFTTEGKAAELRDGAVQVRVPGTDIRPELRWHIDVCIDDGFTRLRLEVENTTSLPLTIERLDVLIAPRGYRGLDTRELDVAQTGWQSWSPASPAVPLPTRARTAPPPVIGPMLPPTEAERTIMPWVAFLRDPDGHSMLAGFAGAKQQSGVLSLQPAPPGHRFTASTYIEGVPTMPGQTVVSETLLLRFDENEGRAMSAYALEVATGMEASHWSHVTTGWCSWYYFFTHVGEEGVLRNLVSLSAKRASMSVEYVQIDDGYQTHIGDWLTLNKKFPRGMRFLTDAIRSRDYRPGLWLAPFLVSEQSDVYSQHPDWVLRDERDLPINAIHNWGTRNYALDVTHPGAEAWLRHVITTMVEEWGYEYLKIDFIYAGALRGKRHNRNMTSIQAYRYGLQIIRDTAAGSFVLGCGAPFLPSVGLVDAMRIGPDVAPFWGDEGDPQGSAPALVNAVRSTLVHGWMHRRLWINDPDCLLVRERDSELTLSEVQTWTSVVGLSGGMVLMSDDVSQLEPQRAAYISLLLPPGGEAAEVLGPCLASMSERMRLQVDRDWRSWVIAAIFNWSSEQQSRIFSPADWNIDPDKLFHLFDLWTQQHWGPTAQAVDLGAVPAHGVRLLQVHPHVGRPQLVGSTLHLLGGALEISNEYWSDATLSVELRCPGEHEGILAIYVPGGFEYVPDQEHETYVMERDRVLRVPLRLVEHSTLNLRFQVVR